MVDGGMVVLIIRTHLLHIVMIVLVTIFSSVKEVAKRFVLQMSSNAMALCIALIKQTNS